MFTIATEDAEDTEKGRVAIVENDRQLRADFAQVIHGNNFGGFYFGSIIDALRKGRRTPVLRPSMRSKRAVAVVFVLAVSLSAGAPADDTRRESAAAVPGSDRPIDPKGWTITAPASGATNAVRVAFPEPIDRGLLDALGALAPDGSPFLRACPEAQ